jgi:uncharacterized protein YdhG (YjbR/CyaY superfamily)
VPGDPTTIDGYLSGLSADKREALQALREVIRAAAPAATVCISYKMPTFKLNGMLVGFAAHANHCGLYAWNATSIADFAGDLTDFEISKGTIRFTPEKPIPPELVRRLVEAKVAKNADLAKVRRRRGGPLRGC